MAQDRRIVYLNPRDLIPSRQNVRSDPGDLAGLAETIREHGILQPLGVAREGNAYRVVYGNRRRDAAIVVGLDRVPCMVLDGLGEEDEVVEQVLENLQRLDLNDLEKSRAFEHLQTRLVEQGASQGDALESIAKSLGLSVRQMQRYLRLRQLSPAVQRLIAQGEIGVTQAQHLVDISPDSRQEEIASLVIEESLSAAELARLCGALAHNANIDPRLALEALRRGERIAVVEAKEREELPQFGAPPAPEESIETLLGAEPGGEGSEEGAEPGQQGAPGGRPGQPGQGRGDYDDFPRGEPVTRDGNRVRKIHSLDSFMDELQRLTACVQDGDLQGFIDEDEAGIIKIRLAARQFRFLSDSIATIAKAYGPLEG